MPQIDTSSDKFEHELTRSEGRVLLRSTCRHCGASKVVSRADGSLEEWESEHGCESRGAPIAS